MELEGVISALKDKKKEQPYFRAMFLYLAEKLPRVLEEFNLTNSYNDPIIWQVRSYLFQCNKSVYVAIYYIASSCASVISKVLLFTYVQMIVQRIFTQKSKALLPLSSILEKREFRKMLYIMQPDISL